MNAEYSWGTCFPQRDYIDVADAAEGFRRLGAAKAPNDKSGPLVSNLGTGTKLCSARSSRTNRRLRAGCAGNSSGTPTGFGSMTAHGFAPRPKRSRQLPDGRRRRQSPRASKRHGKRRGGGRAGLNGPPIRIAAVGITPPNYKASGGISAAFQLMQRVADLCDTRMYVMADRDEDIVNGRLGVALRRPVNRLSSLRVRPSRDKSPR